MQTITITLEVPDGTDIEWLKSELQKYADKLVKEMLADSKKNVCAEPVVALGIEETETLQEEENEYIPCDINGRPLSMAEINARIDQSEKDIAEGKGIPSEEFENELFAYIKSMAS